MTGNPARSTPLAEVPTQLLDCPKCAEPLGVEAASCDFCGHTIVARKPVVVRLIEVASLAAVLAVIILGCRALGTLIGI